MVKLYSIKGYGHYGGGMAVVAANSPERAQFLAGRDAIDSMWGTCFTDSFAVVKELPTKLARGMTEGVLDHFATGE